MRKLILILAIFPILLATSYSQVILPAQAANDPAQNCDNYGGGTSDYDDSSDDDGDCDSCQEDQCSAAQSRVNFLNGSYMNEHKDTVHSTGKGCAPCGSSSSQVSGGGYNVIRLQRSRRSHEVWDFGLGVASNFDYQATLEVDSANNALVAHFDSPAGTFAAMYVDGRDGDIKDGVFHNQIYALRSQFHLLDDQGDLTTDPALAATLVYFTQTFKAYTFEVKEINGEYICRIQSYKDRKGYGFDVAYEIYTDTEINSDPALYYRKSSVNDFTGRSFQFTYNPVALGGKYVIESVTLPNGSVTTYEYTDTYLSKVTHADSNFSTYEYSVNARGETVFKSQETAGKDKELRFSSSVSDQVSKEGQLIWNSQSMSTHSVITEDEVFYNYFQNPTTGNYRYVYRGEGQITFNHLDRRNRYFKNFTVTPNAEGEMDYSSITGSQESNYKDKQWKNNVYGHAYPDRITQKDGTKTYIKYDTSRRVISKSYDDATYEAWHYNDLNLKTVKRDRLGRVTRYTYDAQGEVLTEERGLLDTVTVLTVTNDQVDMTLVQSPAYASKSKEYYPAGHANQYLLRYEWDFNGNRTEYLYDSYQRVISIIEPNDAGTGTITKAQMTYDSAGRLTSSTDAVGRVTTFEHDSRDRLVKTTFNDSSTELNIYGSGLHADLISKTKERNGNVTKHEYDNSARLIKKIIAYSVMNTDGSTETVNPSSLQSVTDYTYLIGQKKVKSKITDGEFTEYFYDYRLRLIETRRYPDNNSSLVTKTVYKNNKVFSREDAYGRKTFYAYRAEDNKLIRQIKGTVPSYNINGYNGVLNKTRNLNNNANYLITDYELDEQGQRVAVIDPRGIRHEMDYDSRGRVTYNVKAAASLAQTTQSIYDANSNVISAIDPVGNVTNMTYGARNKLASRTVGFGSLVEATESFTYYDDGRSKDHTDFRGNVKTTVWHQCCGRLQANIDQDGNYQISNNDFYSNVTHTAVVDKAGVITDYHDLPNGETVQEITTQFDSRHRPIARTLWLQPLGYVDPNNVPIATDPTQGLTTNYLYYDETAGHAELAPLVAELLADGIDLNGEGSATIVINPEGEVQVAIKDGVGRTVAQGALDKDDFANSTYTLVTWSTVIHDTITSGLLETQQVSALGYVNKSRTDGAGRTLEVEDAAGNIATREYDANSNVVKSRDANGIGQDCIFDDLNRDISCTDTEGSVVTKSFDLANRLISSTDSNNQITSNAYDARNRKESTTDRLSGITNFSYDANSNLESITDALGKVTTYQFDVRNLQTQVNYADGKSTTCDYDALRRKSVCTDQLGEKVEYTYDLASRMTQRLYKLTDDSIESTDAFTYDAASRPLSATKGRYNNTVSYTYDSIGRKKTETLVTNGQTFTTECLYDLDSRVTSCEYPNGDIVTKTYTNRNQLEAQNFNAASIADFAYDNGMRESTRTFGNGIVTTKAYNLDNTLTGSTAVSAVNNSLDDISFSYTYDTNKNVLSETSNGIIMDDYSWTASFDAADRVTSWNRAGGTISTQSWNLDLIGNWSSVTTDGTTENRTHNDVHELTDIDGQSATYDDKGNLISVNGKTLSWDIDNHLEVLNDLNLGQTTFTYDALGRRVSKDNSLTGEILFICHGQRVIEEYSNNGTSYELERSYVHGTYVDDLVAKIEADVSPIIHYYHSDRQYNVRGLTDSSGDIVELYAYTPYGKQTILDSSGIELLSSIVQNNYGYTGRYKDTDTELWYFRARYFSDELGRFISRDPLGYVDGMSLYAGYFAQWQGLDPSGLEWKMVCDRCWFLDEFCCERTGNWMYKSCRLINTDTGERVITEANNFEDIDVGTGNNESTDPNDPYGPNGPLEPGDYNVHLEDSGLFGPNTPTVSNNDSGGVTTSEGNERTNIRIHPIGGTSLGCISCNDGNFYENEPSPFVEATRRAVQESDGSIPLTINDVGSCPCEEP